MKRTDLYIYLINEAEYSPEKVAKMSNIELLNAWLKYNGIVGYTYDIIDVLEALGVKHRWT